MSATSPRVHRAAWARARFGERADRCFAALERCVPLADALVDHLAEFAEPGRPFELSAAWADFRAGIEQPAPVCALLEAVGEVPSWVHGPGIAASTQLFERGGIFGGLTLGMRALMGGYAAPAGNKPLALTGRLRDAAPRRVAETLRFVTAVCAPGGMERGAPGWMISLHVRLMHAQVRRLVRLSGRWDSARWAEPINQHDMLATMLLFSEVYVEGLRIFGFIVSEAEAQAWIELWRYVGWVMGTELELLPRDYAEASQLRELIEQTQGPPDADSRALAAALLAGPRIPDDAGGGARALIRARAGLSHGVCRMLMGDAVADGLGVEPAPLAAQLLPVIPAVIGGFERLRVLTPVLAESQRELGRRYWTWAERVSLAGKPARYGRPSGLA